MEFELKVLGRGNGVTALTLDAASTDEAQRAAAARGYTVLAVRASRARDTWRMKSPLRTRYPIVLFSQELLALLRAGLSLVEALETLAEKESHAAFRTVLSSVNASLQEGKTFSAALDAHPSVFPSLYTASVKASERTGDLIEALSRYVAYRTQSDAVRKKFVSASIYPVILVVAGMLVTVFLMAYVVPRFSQIYADMGDKLPLASRLLLRWGQIFEQHGTLLGAGALALVVLTAHALTRPATRAAFSEAMWRIPAVGERMKVYQFARFYRTLGMLLRGGTPLVSAMAMSAQLLHVGLRARLEAARSAIQDGAAIAQSFESNGLTTPVAMRMLRVGERSGTMAEMTERIAEFCDDEIARWVDWFTRLFEPLLMALIGLVIGLIVVLMYMPIFELAGGIQ